MSEPPLSHQQEFLRLLKKPLWEELPPIKALGDITELCLLLPPPHQGVALSNALLFLHTWSRLS